MKGQWLRGVLLGVSLALLLAGGVVLAADLYITASKECVECVDRQGPGPGEDNFIDIQYGGWEVGDYLCLRWKIGSEYVVDSCAYATEPSPGKMTDLIFPCDVGTAGGDELSMWGDVGPLIAPTSFLGENTFRISKENPIGTEVDAAGESFVVAEECAVDFVPEPGSVLLLGSGLAGLAGYAALRLGSGQALRRGSR